jgi:hypothetical protein
MVRSTSGAPGFAGRMERYKALVRRVLLRYSSDIISEEDNDTVFGLMDEPNYTVLASLDADIRWKMNLEIARLLLACLYHDTWVWVATPKVFPCENIGQADDYFDVHGKLKIEKFPFANQQVNALTLINHTLELKGNPITTAGMLIAHLFQPANFVVPSRSSRKRSKDPRGWNHHIGSRLYQYILESVLPGLRESYVDNDPETRSEETNSTFPAFSAAELNDVIAEQYTEFFRGRGENEWDAIVYLTTKSQLNRNAGQYTLFSYAGALSENDIVAQPENDETQNGLAQRRREIEKRFKDNFWSFVATVSIPVDGVIVKMNPRHLLCGFLLNKFCDPLNKLPNVAAMDLMAGYKLTRSHTIRSLFKKFGVHEHDTKVREGLKNAYKQKFFKDKDGWQQYPFNNSPKLRAQWKLATSIILEGENGEGISNEQRNHINTILSGGNLQEIFRSASTIGITDAYMNVLVAMQEEYDAVREDMFESESVTMPDIKAQWGDGLPQSVKDAIGE